MYNVTIVKDLLIIKLFVRISIAQSIIEGLKWRNSCKKKRRKLKDFLLDFVGELINWMNDLYLSNLLLDIMYFLFEMTPEDKKHPFIFMCRQTKSNFIYFNYSCLIYLLLI